MREFFLIVSPVMHYLNRDPIKKLLNKRKKVEETKQSLSPGIKKCPPVPAKLRHDFVYQHNYNSGAYSSNI